MCSLQSANVRHRTKETLKANKSEGGLENRTKINLIEKWLRETLVGQNILASLSYLKDKCKHDHYFAAKWSWRSFIPW